MKPLRVALLTISAVLLSLPASALAAPPANDDFADREVLTGTLPIEAERSNVEATKEDGEYIPGLSPAGHSVWFEWEAQSTGYVTVGACDEGFPVIVRVFTGAELDALSLVADGNGAEGPNCPFSQRQYTFKATSGTKYAIAVDGNNFTGPEPVPVQTEGGFSLRIEETPAPANDDFEDATVLQGEIEEEPNGDRFYLLHTVGFNWNATTEPGEPDGVSSGASVWYTWTVPADGTYRFGVPCCGTAISLNLDLFSGDEVDDLSPVLVGEDFAERDLTGGQTLRIRISGPLDPGTAEPLMATFSSLITAELAPLPSLPPSSGSTPSPPDTAAPDTSISKYVLKRIPPIFSFKFSSNEPGSTFRCSLDRRPFKPCGSSKTFRKPIPGRHRLRVYAVDAAGNADGSPAVARFRVPRKGRS